MPPNDRQPEVVWQDRDGVVPVLFFSLGVLGYFSCIYFLFLAEGQEGSQTQRDHSGECGSQESNHSRVQPRIGEPAAARSAPCRLLLAHLHHTCHTRLGL